MSRQNDAVDNTMALESIHQEQEERRRSFLHALENFVPKRPRLHRDRTWLEGYCQASALVRAIMSRSLVPQVVTSFRHIMQTRSIPNKITGHIDAWLDSVDC